MSIDAATQHGLHGLDLREIIEDENAQSRRIITDPGWYYPKAPGWSKWATRYHVPILRYRSPPGIRQFRDRQDERSPNRDGTRHIPSLRRVMVAAEDDLRRLEQINYDRVTMVPCGFLNAEFGNEEKAEQYADLWNRILRAHVLFGFAEVDNPFVQTVANLANCYGIFTEVNDRGQGLGLVVDRSCEILDHGQWDDAAQAGGIQQLRPPLWALVQLPGGQVVLVVVNHNKSMNGGVQATSFIREEINVKTASHMAETGLPLLQLLMGDQNFLLNEPNHREAKPFAKIGLRLVQLEGDQSTHIRRSRLDGFYTRGGLQIVNHKTFMGQQYWDKVGGPEPSDHAGLTGQLRFAS